VRIKERWPCATPVTRANHGIDNDRIEAHANLVGMGDFNCRAEIDLSPRGGLSCARNYFSLLFFYLTSSLLSLLLSSMLETWVHFHATETLIVITPRRSQSHRNRIWNPVREQNSSIRFCAPLNFLFLFSGTMSPFFVQWFLKIAAMQNKLSLCYLRYLTIIS